MEKIIIADVLYTNTDETFYVRNCPYEQAEIYIADTLADTLDRLKADGWQPCGQIKTNDPAPTLAQLLRKNNNYIAAWLHQPLVAREQMRLFVEKEKKPPGTIRQFSSGEIKNALERMFSQFYDEVKTNQPSDYCYNLWNEDFSRTFPDFNWPAYFIRTDKDRYRMLGADYPYSGEIFDAKSQFADQPHSVGYWQDGTRYRYDAPAAPFNDTNESTVHNPAAPEGKRTQHYVTKYERSAKNRAAAIVYHGLTCAVCGFNFAARYGAQGSGYIEVHHNKPLYSLDEEILINPTTDLDCVCANCHRMFHRKKDAILTVAELKSLLI